MILGIVGALVLGFIIVKVMKSQKVKDALAGKGNLSLLSSAEGGKAGSLLNDMGKIPLTFRKTRRNY